jgi:nucleolin
MFKIFVGNLGPTGVTEEAIRTLFSRYVDIEDIALPMDEATGKLRGFAIVMVRDEQKARAAMAAVRGSRLNGRPLIINQARKKGKVPLRREYRRGFRAKGGGYRSSTASCGGQSSYGTGYGGSGGYGGDPGRPRGGYGDIGGDRGGARGSGGGRRDFGPRGPRPGGPASPRP